MNLKVVLKQWYLNTMIKIPVICIDIEASGLGPGSYPIEIAWKCGLTGDSDSFLIDPATGYNWTDWDPAAEDLHHITVDELLAEGVSVREACKRPNTRLHGKTLTCDAVDFDYFWIRRLYESARMNPSFEVQGIDKVLGGGQLIQYRLVANAQVRNHRAMDDVNDLLACLAACDIS